MSSSSSSSSAAAASEGKVDADLLALQKIDETCVQLQRQGKYLEALECMERGLVLRQHFFGVESSEVWDACKTVAEMCNLLAMTYLQQDEFSMVQELLKKAEILTERDEAGRAVTYNNTACYYRRTGKLHSALQYLQKALRIESRLPAVQNPADTHLNMCAVLSQLGRHQQALEHAQTALILLQEELYAKPLGGASGSASAAALPSAADTSASLGGTGGDLAHAKPDRIAVLAIAYHNIGVEQEFLKKHSSTLQSYRKGVEVAEKFLGVDHGITVTLRNSYLAARRGVGRAAGAGAAAAATGSVGPGASTTRRSVSPDGKAMTASQRRAAAATAPHGGGDKVSYTVTQKDEHRWGEISAAYGHLDGPKPVKAAARSHSASRLSADHAPQPVQSKHEGMITPRK